MIGKLGDMYKQNVVKKKYKDAKDKAKENAKENGECGFMHSCTPGHPHMHTRCQGTPTCMHAAREHLHTPTPSPTPAPLGGLLVHCVLRVGEEGRVGVMGLAFPSSPSHPINPVP